MKRLIRKEDGSITLEAAIVMPFFILFLVFLIYMIKFALVDIAINRATSEATKQVATQLYPAEVVVDEVHTVVEGTDIYQDLVPGIQENIGNIEETVIDTLGNETYNSIKEGAGAVLDEAGAAAFTSVVNMYLEKEEEMNIVNRDNIKVTSVVIPNILTGSGDKYVELTTEYELDLPIPFIEEAFIIEKHSKERAWVGS
ncbi:TadE-like protein [Gracilibacillus orientalis]|uniref:TadE-like protein n=1 Tax=Gracilibacillus orientalis TaxID=334253 RepID=A0A1I4P547_9BACI|nr:TadE family protein [Gracilibacillus orientalis]SFM22902.1 TadE-like protein [Gracilibacillus orientalis]